MPKVLAAGAALVGLSLVLASCSLGGKSATTTTTAKSTTTTASTTSSTVALAHVTGARTVLSPIGVNVRAKPSLRAKILGTAAQGAVLSVLGRTGAAGGWFRVRGATVTGWMSANPALSATGHFSSYNTGEFGLLYPASWTVRSAKSSVHFSSPLPGGLSVVVSTASSISKLPQLRPGVGSAVETGSRHILTCGVTTYLDSFSVGKQQIEQVLLPLGTAHALGLQGYLTRPAQLRIFLDVVNSVWFPLPQCIGVPPAKPAPAVGHKAPAATAATHKAPAATAVGHKSSGKAGPRVAQ
ncbi:MAG: SH3 domain-containing protein [Acidimicrobiales bacterium]